MPELPEVETIRRDLSEKVSGRTFSDVTIYWPRSVGSPSPAEFRRCLIGQTIEEIARRGKYLLFHLSGRQVLAVHLRMTGALLLRPASAEPDPYLRILFPLDDGMELRFADPRKLGRVWLLKDEKVITDKLGPEPLETSFTPEVMARNLHRRSAPIKAVLCDQSFLAGVGNIYADEALFEAAIHPLREARTLSEEETRRLHCAISKVLERGIANRGTTFSDYRDASGNPGANQEVLRVAHRRGKPCPRCGTPIERISLRGRGTYFCPHCQRLPYH